MPATLSDVARLAGVSEATASRAINGRRYVSIMARDRVAAAVRQLDFVPNSAARHLSLARTTTATLLVHHAQYPSLGEGTFGTRVLLGVSRALRRHGYDLLYGEVDDDAVNRLLEQSAVRAGRTDGLILLGPLFPPREVIDLAAERPVVLVDNRVDGQPIDAVMADNRDAVESLTSHLVTVHGHARIGCIAGPTPWASTAERVAGYRAAMEAAGQQPRIVHAEETTVRHGANAAAELHAADPRITAVVAVNDAMAVGALHRARGVVGWRPAVVGFDDSAWAALADPPLTTVSVDAAAMGGLAVDRLIERIEGRAAPDEEWLARVPATPRIRRSCGCAGEATEGGDLRGQ